MRKLTMTLTAAAFVLGTMVIAANAQAGFHAQVQNATPIVKQAACRGLGGRCPPGLVWRCGPYGRCGCVSLLLIVSPG